MIESINNIKAVKILKEYSTKGSGPLLIEGDDGQLYVTKFTNQNHPYLELINEVICNGLAKCWGLKVPEMVIVTFVPEVVDDFDFSSNTRYRPEYFDKQFFGVRFIENPTEMTPYYGKLSKRVYSQFEDPLDLLRIGCFDHWIGNKDRRPENPNILISLDEESGKLCFHPIDHAAAFAYLPYREVRDIMLHLEKTILENEFSKSICKYEEKEVLENLSESIEISISNTLKDIDSVFDLVPKDWGFSKKSKKKLKEFLSDQERNERISKVYLGYLKR